MRKNKLRYDDTTFSGLLRIAGIREFLSFSTFLSVIISFFLWWYVLKEDIPNSYELIKVTSPILIGAAATIFSISIAALSITISVFYKPALPMMVESKLLHKYLFPFWKTIVLWGLVIVSQFSFMIITTLNQKNFIYFSSDLIFAISTFLFLYSVFYTIRLTGEVIRLTLLSSQK